MKLLQLFLSYLILVFSTVDGHPMRSFRGFGLRNSYRQMKSKETENSLSESDAAILENELGPQDSSLTIDDEPETKNETQLTTSIRQIFAAFRRRKQECCSGSEDSSSSRSSSDSKSESSSDSDSKSGSDSGCRSSSDSRSNSRSDWGYSSSSHSDRKSRYDSSSISSNIPSSSSSNKSRQDNNSDDDLKHKLEMIEEQCGNEVKMLDKLEKVTPNDVRHVLSSAAQVTKQMAADFSQHSNDIAELEDNMTGRHLEELVSSHVKLIGNFGSLLEDASKKGLCDFISIQMLFDRIMYLGGEGFVDLRCNEAYRMVSEFDLEKMKGPIPITLEWLYKFGEAIRNDMYCIMDDIDALWQHISSLKLLTENNENPSLRAIHIGLSTIMGFEAILEDEIDRFHYAVQLIGEALNYVDLQELEDRY